MAKATRLVTELEQLRDEMSPAQRAKLDQSKGQLVFEEPTLCLPSLPMCKILHIMIDVVEIAEQVRAARKIRKMTQLQLAERSGLSQRQIVAFENGQAPNLGFISIVRILRAVGLEFQVTEAKSRRPTYEELLAEQQR